MKRPFTPEPFLPRKRPHMDTSIQLEESNKRSDATCVGASHLSSRFYFGDRNTTLRTFDFRCPLQNSPRAVTDSSVVQVRLAACWLFDFKGPQTALETIIDALPLMARVLVPGHAP